MGTTYDTIHQRDLNFSFHFPKMVSYTFTCIKVGKVRYCTFSFRVIIIAKQNALLHVFTNSRTS